MDPIYHVATAADWAAAQVSGTYSTSTRGVDLATEGFVHASTAAQWRGVLERYWSDADEPLVLLEIDPARLGCPVVMEPPTPGAAELFPHVLGPVPPSAVLSVRRLGPPGAR